jgi:hypothetical protein
MSRKYPVFPFNTKKICRDKSRVFLPCFCHILKKQGKNKEKHGKTGKKAGFSCPAFFPANFYEWKVFPVFFRP